MKTIAEIAKLPSSRITKGLYGLEIEVEGVNLPTTNPSMWVMEKDGSLKTEEAWEYVMPKPTSLSVVKERLDYLAQRYKDCDSTVHESIRAGVHVHMNVQSWDIKQLITFATCYYILEDVLLKWCGESREGNLFCLRTRDAEFVLFQLVKSLQTKNLKYLNNDIIRYASLNFLSLFKYGSVEFRGMRGTGDLDLIYKWAKMIDELRQSSLQFDNPTEVVGNMSGAGEIQFMKMLLPTMWTELDYPDIDKIIRTSARRVQMLAYTVDWEAIAAKNKNIFDIEREGF